MTDKPQPIPEDIQNMEDRASELAARAAETNLIERQLYPMLSDHSKSTDYKRAVLDIMDLLSARRHEREATYATLQKRITVEKNL
jgi:hypothetical protein